MRISTKSYMDLLHQSVQTAEDRLGILTQQIASGKRIQRPSDDPVGAGQALRAHAALEKSLSDQSTLEQAVTLNNALDSALGNMTSPLQTALNAALSATQTGLGSTGLAACATEVRAAMEQLVTCGNAEFNGIYLMAGTDNRQSPLSTTGNPADVVTYSGNEQAMQITISPGRVAPLTVTGQNLFNFARTDSECEGPEGAMCRSVTVAADYRLSRLRQPELGPDYVDNTVVGMSYPVQRDAVLGAVLFQLFDQSCRQRISGRPRLVSGRHDVVHGRHHPMRSMDSEPAVAQALERLWRRDFVNQVKIYVKDDRGVGFRNHDMRLPDFLKQRFWFHTVTISAT